MSIGIFVGRMQPVTVLHQKIINDMKHDKVYVILIEGQKSSEEKKNFLSFNDRIEILKITNPKAKVIHSREGYIPDIIENNRLNPDNEDVYIVAGTDRIDSYMRQFKSVPYKVYKEEVPRQAEDVSATKVRDALLKGDFGAYKRMVAKGLDNEKWFTNFRKKLAERYGNEIQ